MQWCFFYDYPIHQWLDCLALTVLKCHQLRTDPIRYFVLFFLSLNQGLVSSRIFLKYLTLQLFHFFIFYLKILTIVNLKKYFFVIFKVFAILKKKISRNFFLITQPKRRIFIVTRLSKM